MVGRVEESGSVIEWHRLDDDAYEKELRLKLKEETHEVFTASSEKELIEELADVLEVLESLCAGRGLSLDAVKEVQLAKRESKGGFGERCYVTVAHHPEGSFAEQYCLASPEKYPEIFQNV